MISADCGYARGSNRFGNPSRNMRHIDQTITHMPKRATAMKPPEDVLKEVESRAAPIVRRLANPQYVLTPENAGHLIMFVAFMFVRVPAWREHLDKVAAQVFRDS